MRFASFPTVCALVGTLALGACAEEGSDRRGAHEVGGARTSSMFSCDELDDESCAASGKCLPVVGRLLDQTQRCIGGSKFFACTASRECDAGLGYRRDGEGNIWQFTSSGDDCAASGLQIERDSEARGWGGYPLCTPPAPSPHVRCSELSNAATAPRALASQTSPAPRRVR